MTIRVADALDDAADIIEANGWVQGAKWKPGEGYCVIGAIEMAIYHNTWNGRPVRTLNDKYSVYLACVNAVQNEVPFEFVHVPAWNDCEIRVCQEVLDTLRLVAKKEREC